MNLNQVTLTVLALDPAIRFYQTLGLKLIVRAEDHYARFECPIGDATFSLHTGPVVAGDGAPLVYFEVDDLNAEVDRLIAAGLTFETLPVDQPWLWQEAFVRDPSGNRICLYHAAGNRKNPPWRLS